LVGQDRENLRERIAKLSAAALALNRQSRRNLAGANSAPFSLAFLTDAKRCPHPERIARAIPRGAAVVLRDYGAPARKALALRLRTICSERGLLLLVGGDATLAREVGADGVHLRARDLSQYAQSPIQNLIVSAACHSLDELQLVHKTGAHVAFLSPVFEQAMRAPPRLASSDLKKSPRNHPCRCWRWAASMRKMHASWRARTSAGLARLARFANAAPSALNHECASYSCAPIPSFEARQAAGLEGWRQAPVIPCFPNAG